MNQTMTLAGARHQHPHATQRAEVPRTRTRRSAAGSILRGAGEAGRWLLLAAAAPELLIAEEHQMKREMHADARRDA